MTFITGHIFSCSDGEVTEQTVDVVRIVGRDILRVHVTGQIESVEHAAMLRRIADYIEANSNEDAA